MDPSLLLLLNDHLIPSRLERILNSEIIDVIEYAVTSNNFVCLFTNLIHGKKI